MFTKHWEKRGFIWRADAVADWWDTCTMAPAPIDLGDGRVRIFVGGWKMGGQHPVSRIGYIDVDADCPTKVLAISRQPVADIGPPGTYSDSGIFPAHATKLADGRIYLYTTGFQHSCCPEVDHLHFSGLLCSNDNGNTFEPFSLAPVLDRADEGLHIRAGLSVYQDTDGGFHSVYAVGSGFCKINGKFRANYDICYQHVADGIHFSRQGKKIIALDKNEDYAWGRPQLLWLEERWVVLAARRMLNGCYHIGCATSTDLKQWHKCNEWVKPICHGSTNDFDDNMVYYPAVCHTADKTYLFYSGNGFGRGGLGYAKLQ